MIKFEMAWKMDQNECEQDMIGPVILLIAYGFS